MTRLKTEWISDIEKNASLWNHRLKEMCGMNFIEVAAEASGRRLSELELLRKKTKVAVVPITVGLGVISTFTQSVAATPKAMGFETFITENSDVDGFYEAYKKGADIVYVADDERYLAINLNKRKIGDNNEATAAGYVTVLKGLLAKKENFTLGIENLLRERKVLLLGYGIVGKLAADRLSEEGAEVTVFERSPVEEKRAEAKGFAVLKDKDKIKEYSLILDATCEGDWITANMLKEDLRMSTPGVPFSLDEEAIKVFEDRVIHDYLEIGTAVMLAMAL